MDEPARSHIGVTQQYQEKKGLKKVLALLLVLVLAIGMFAACGTDSGNNERSKDTNNATTEGGNTRRSRPKKLGAANNTEARP